MESIVHAFSEGNLKHFVMDIDEHVLLSFLDRLEACAAAIRARMALSQRKHISPVDVPGSESARGGRSGHKELEQGNAMPGGIDTLIRVHSPFMHALEFSDIRTIARAGRSNAACQALSVDVHLWKARVFARWPGARALCDVGLTSGDFRVSREPKLCCGERCLHTNGLVRCRKRWRWRLYTAAEKGKAFACLVSEAITRVLQQGLSCTSAKV